MCVIWTDHEWTRQRFLETGRHPSLGHYNKYLVTCERCLRTTTRTDWCDPLGCDLGSFKTARGAAALLQRCRTARYDPEYLHAVPVDEPSGVSVRADGLIPPRADGRDGT